MRRMNWGLLLVLVGLCGATTASAQESYPEVVAQRPLVIDEAMMQFSLDYTAGLYKDRVFDDMFVGIGFGYGVIDDLELGIDIEALSYSKDVYDAKFGGASLYGRYRFLDQLAAELVVYMPGDHTYIDDFGEQLMGVTLNVPFQYIAVENMLKIHARLGFDLGFVSDEYATSGGESPQMAILLSYGVTYNPLSALFIDLTFGTDMTLQPSDGSFGDRTAIPMALTVGGTIMSGDLDIFATFALGNLMPPEGVEVFDQMIAAIGAQYRL